MILDAKHTGNVAARRDGRPTRIPSLTNLTRALAWNHHVPFDRMLVVQAQRERLVLVHADPIIRSFGGVTQLWAERP
jgi:PIN domain nuclease of toxin-antitoxin system